MKRITLLLATLMIAGAVFAHDGGKKECCKKGEKKECCKKNGKECAKDKEAKKESTGTTAPAKS